MSRKLRTLVVTLVARSFSSLEPAATFCLSKPAIVSLATLTACVPGPALPAGEAAAAAGAAAAGAAGGGALGCAGASVAAAPSAREARTIDRRSMGLLSIVSIATFLRTATAGVKFTGGTIEAYHGDVPLEDRLCPARTHLEPR